MRKYISAFLAFGAAVIGVFGDTHLSDKTGFASITELGWATITIAFVSFIITGISTWRDQRKINWQSLQKEQIRKIANREVWSAANKLLDPFAVFLNGIAHEHYDEEIFIGKTDNIYRAIDMEPEFLLDQLVRNPPIKDRLAEIDLRKRLSLRSEPVYVWQYLSESAIQAGELLDATIMKYGTYLKAETIIAIENLRNDELVHFRFPNLDELLSMNEKVDNLTVLHGIGRDPNYAVLQEMFNKVETIYKCTSKNR